MAVIQLLCTVWVLSSLGLATTMNRGPKKEVCDSGFYRVSSSGPAGQHQSYVMGDYHPTGHSVNGFSIFGKFTHYLYMDSTGAWVINDEPGVEGIGWINHPDPVDIPTPPIQGWQYAVYGEGDDWFDDSSLTVVGINNDFYRVSSSGGAAQHQNHTMGDYYPTGHSVNGSPIFGKFTHYLSVQPGGLWIIGDEAGVDAGSIYHPEDNPTPTTPPINGWIYLNENDEWSEDNDSSLTVVGFDV